MPKHFIQHWAKGILLDVVICFSLHEVIDKAGEQEVQMKAWPGPLYSDSQASPKFLHRANVRNINSIHGQGLPDHFQLSGQDGSAPSALVSYPTR